MTFRVGLLGFLLLSSCVPPTGPAATRTDPPLGHSFGVTAHIAADVVETPALLDKAAAAGFSLVRTDLAWTAVENPDADTPGVFDFSPYDGLVDHAASLGLRVLFVLDYGNRAYTGDTKNPPRDDTQIAAFARFAGAAAAHYRGKPVEYEVWNEPNLAWAWAEPRPRRVRPAGGGNGWRRCAARLPAWSSMARRRRA